MISAIPRLSVLVHSLAPCVALVMLCQPGEGSLYLLKLASMRGLLDEVEKALREFLVGQRVGCSSVVGHGGCVGESIRREKEWYTS
jgi:hypothetical protein